MYLKHETIGNIPRTLTPNTSFLPTLQIRAVIWLTIRVPWRPHKRPLPLPLRRRPPIVARKALVSAPVPVSLHQLRIRMRVPEGALPRGLRAAVRRICGGLVHTPDPSDRAVGFVGGFALGVRDFGSGSLLKGCGFGLLELLFGGFGGLFGEFLLGGAGAFGAGAGAVA